VAAAAERRAAVEQLAAMMDEPPKLWQAAVELVKTYTAAGGVYVAQIVSEEEPDWAPAEDAGEEGQVGGCRRAVLQRKPHRDLKGCVKVVGMAAGGFQQAGTAAPSLHMTRPHPAPQRHHGLCMQRATSSPAHAG
jgi:hypothetical protein